MERCHAGGEGECQRDIGEHDAHGPARLLWVRAATRGGGNAPRRARAKTVAQATTWRAPHATMMWSQWRDKLKELTEEALDGEGGGGEVDAVQVQIVA